MIEQLSYILVEKWGNLNLILSGVLLVGYVVVDGLYAYYTISVAERSPFASANSGAVIHLLLAFGVLSYVGNFLYLIPIAIGSWVGTYLMVKYSLVNKNNGRT